jgi:diguanylate cyclase (GGDEF)-like protein
MSKKIIIGVGIPLETVENLKKQFDPEEFEFVNFPSAQELIKNINTYTDINLIFVYNQLPDLKDCQELCIALRSETNTETVPIIVLSHMEKNQEEKIKMLKSGLVDGYLHYLVSPEELTAYANVFLQRQALEEELEEKNELLSTLSNTDELTKLFNRRYLIQRLEEELKRIQRYNYPLSCIMLDLDHFKQVNDKFGHAHGDLVLEQLSFLTKKTVRATDIVCRYGGEEIVIVLPYTNYDGAYIVARRLRKRVEEYAFGTIDKSLELTISIGLITVDNNDRVDIDTLLQVLDQQLYEAKNTGRNKTCGGLYKDKK